MRESLGENEGPRGVRGRGWSLLVQTHFTLAELPASAEIERNSTFRGLVVELIRCITVTFFYKYFYYSNMHYNRMNTFIGICYINSFRIE